MYFAKNNAQNYPNDWKDIYYTNAADLLGRVNPLLEEIGATKPVVNSGWRPSSYNARIGGAPHSNHITCKAVDLNDPFGGLKSLITAELLEKHDLAMEHPDATPGWCHLQTVLPASGRRIFKP